MAPGLVAGCWVFLAGTMQLAKYTNRKKKKKKKRKRRKERREEKRGERVRKACVNPSKDIPHLVTPYENIQIATLSTVKGDFCRTLRSDSMGIDIQIYIRREVHALPSPFFSAGRGHVRALSATNNQPFVVFSYWGRREEERKRDGICILFFFFLSLFLLSSLFLRPSFRFVCLHRVYDIVSSPILAKLERKRQMQGNLRSSFFWPL